LGVSIVVILFVAVIVLALTALMVVAWCMIFKRAGYSWALGLLSIVPIANVIIVLVLAFSRWPVQDQLDQYKIIAGAPRPAPQYGPGPAAAPRYQAPPPPPS